MAEFYGVSLAPHCIASPLGLMAAAHLCATAPTFVALEFHGQDVPFWDALVLRSAAAGACDVVFTEDMQHGQSLGGVRVENPFAG